MEVESEKGGDVCCGQGGASPLIRMLVWSWMGLGSAYPGEG